MKELINDSPRLAENFRYLGSNLNVDLYYAMKNEYVESDSTQTFLDFLLSAEDETNLIGGLLPMIGKVGYIDSGTGIIFHSGVTDAINYMDMLIKINDYLTKEMNGSNKIDKNFLKKTYFPFIENCRRTARNVMRPQKVRLKWEGKFMKEPVEIYKDFIDYLRK